MPVPATAPSAPTMFLIVPPVPAEPLPDTVRLPLEPVVLSTIPLAPPLAVMLRNFNPPAPIVVLATLRAVPVVVVSVLAVSVAVTVPPPVAAKAGFVPVLRVKVALNPIVEPALLLNDTPLPEVTLRVPA